MMEEDSGRLEFRAFLEMEMGCPWGEVASVGTARRMPHLRAGAGTGQTVQHPYQDAVSLRRGFLERGENNLKNLSVPSLNPREEKPPGVPLPLRLPQQWWRLGLGQLRRNRKASRARGRALASLSQAFLSPPPPAASGSSPAPLPLPACLVFWSQLIKGEENLLSSSRNCPGKKEGGRDWWKTTGPTGSPPGSAEDPGVGPGEEAGGLGPPTAARPRVPPPRHLLVSGAASCSR